MLLVLTNSQDATADYLTAELEKQGIEYVRLDTDTLLSISSISYGGCGPRLRIYGQWYAPEDFHATWYRRPERLRAPHLTGYPEGEYILDEWSEALESFLAHISIDRWVNHPANNSRASSKLEQLTTAKQFDLMIPATLVTQNADELRQFFTKHGGQVIVKPMASGQVRRESENADSLIYTNPIREADLSDLTDLRACPTFFQHLIPKVSDIRITIVDSDFHAVELLAADPDGRQRCDIRRNNMDDVIYSTIDLPDDIECKLKKLMSWYGLRFGAIDMVVDRQGSWYFLEVNPNGQWAWLDLEGVTRIADSFAHSFSDPG